MFYENAIALPSPAAEWLVMSFSVIMGYILLKPTVKDGVIHGI
jgi:hypothetical protein